MAINSSVFEIARNARGVASETRGPSRSARRSLGLAAARAASRVEPLESRVLFSADAIRDLPGFATDTLGMTDDRSVEAYLYFGSSLNFYGEYFDSLFVNNNGNVTFGMGMTAYQTTPIDMLASKMIAPFFADVDNLRAGTPVTYGSDYVDGHAAFGVNYFNVNYYPSRTPHVNRNTFQLVIIDRSDVNAGDFDVEFNYSQIQWESGQFAGGDVNGLGGTSARVGFTAGTGMPGTYFELAGSGVAGSFLDSNLETGLTYTSFNSDVAGRYVFSFRNGSWSVGGENNAPTLTVPADSEVIEGADGRTRLPAGFSGFFVDPDNDAWTATVDYGDGSGPQALSLNEDKSFSLDHEYSNAGVYTVVVALSDGNGGETSAQFQVTAVDRSVPVVDVSVPGRVLEGGSVTLRASTAADPDMNDFYAFEWLIDGQVAGVGSEFTMSVPDSGTFMVTLIAMDQAGNGTTLQVPVVVENVAPTATFAASAASVNEGGSLGFSFSGASDASAADLAGLTYSYDLNGDGVFEVSGSAPSAAQMFAQDGVYVVRGRVTDKDGGYTEYTATVAVANVPPVITQFASGVSSGGISATTGAPVVSSAAVTVSGAFLDPGVLDMHTASVDWGDGTRTNGVAILPGATAGSWTFAASHVYGGGGKYTVTVMLSDGVATTTTSTVTVVAGASLRRGVLQVVGTSGDDRVEISKQGKKLRVQADFLPGGEQLFDYNAVDKLSVDLASGRNRLTVSKNVERPVTYTTNGQTSTQGDSRSTVRQLFDQLASRVRDLFNW